MTHAGKIESLRGKTLRWTFTDGPTAGTTYEHTFYEDDSVVYRSVEASEKGKPARAKDEVTPRTKCATVKVADDIFVISYLTALSPRARVMPTVRRPVALMTKAIS